MATSQTELYPVQSTTDAQTLAHKQLQITSIPATPLEQTVIGCSPTKAEIKKMPIQTVHLVLIYKDCWS
jgi:hypothetical protein